jgi:RNA-binding protein YlmH
MTNQEKSFLLNKIEDMISLTDRRGKFTNFLDEASLYAVEKYLKSKEVNACYYGGFENADRKIVGIFPNGVDVTPSYFPIVRLKATYFGDKKLSHRDFLGALINGGIKRDAIGDIFVGEKSADLFVIKSVAPYICENISYIGGSAVKIAEDDSVFLPKEKEYEEISVTVKYPRLDAVVAHLSNFSRDKANDFINHGKVLINYSEEVSKTDKIKNGDILTIRTVGKFLIDSADTLTAKGRVKIIARKYK